MAVGVTREEFDELADEKAVTRHILEQTRRNSDDLAALKTRVTRVEEKVDVLDGKVDSLDHKSQRTHQGPATPRRRHDARGPARTRASPDPQGQGGYDSN